MQRGKDMKNKILIRTVAAAAVLALVAAVFAGCGKQSGAADKSNKKSDGKYSVENTADGVAKSYSYLMQTGDMKTAYTLLLYDYPTVLSAATGEFESADEYYAKTYSCEGETDYYKIYKEYLPKTMYNVYGTTYTVETEVADSVKLSDAQVKLIKDYITAFFAAYGLKADEYAGTDKITEIYAVTVNNIVKGTQSTVKEENYLSFKVGNKWKTVKAENVKKDDFTAKIDALQSRIDEVSAKSGSSELLTRSVFNSYYYYFGLPS